ncbi:MAG: spore coat associated protein CotJA [Ruminococcaceae bacterium]|nr:spore coat associated protein CotJA [Oscillospiraceae bacterium]
MPWQRFENLYDNEFKALDRGTLFKDLDLEFLGRSCK